MGQKRTLKGDKKGRDNDNCNWNITWNAVNAFIEIQNNFFEKNNKHIFWYLTWKYKEEAGGVHKPFDWEFPTFNSPRGEFKPNKSDIEDIDSPAISVIYLNN